MDNKQTLSNRIEFIDIAKGLCIICIILGHLGYHYINRFVYTFHVPIFFIITGYFINSKRTIKEFIKNKARILLVPYFITCLVIVILGTILEGDFGLIKWIIASLYATGVDDSSAYYPMKYRPNVPDTIFTIKALWFLWAAFWASVFVRITLEVNKYLRILTIFALFLLGCKYRHILWLPLSIQAGAAAALFMYLGYLIKENQIYIREFFSKLSAEVKFFLVCLALMAWILLIKDYRGFYAYFAYYGKGGDILASLCACGLVILFAQKLHKFKAISKPFLYFGRYSLLVLCVHNVEFLLFPWEKFADKIIDIMSISNSYQLIIIIIAKLIFDFTIVFLLSKNQKVRKLFGYNN